MATLQQHIYAIKNIINKGPASDDTRISDGVIAFYLKKVRSLLMKRKLDRENAISDTNYMTVCIPLERHTYHDCSCIPDVFDCQILRSTCEIPKEITRRSSSTLEVRFASGKLIDKGSITTNDLSAYSLTNTDPKIAWFVEKNKLYIINDLKLKVVLLRLIPDDPEELSGFCTCNEDESMNEQDSCYDPHEDEFPIDGELELAMLDMTEERIRKAYGYAEDNENNSRSNQVVNDSE